MIGSVQKPLIPLIITFDENKVEYICTVLGQSITQAYEVIHMFGMVEEEEE
jgi:hypothetical protein